MAGNYNYDSLMSRNQFYDEYAPISAWARYQQANFPDSYKESNFYSNPTYRATMVNGADGGSRSFHDDFNQAYGRYNNLFNDRQAAAANAEAARLAAIKQQEELRRQAAAEKARLEAEAAARIKASRMTGSAIQASNEILGGGSTNTPTATLTKKQPKQSRGARTTGSSLRIGQTANAAGSGSNLSI